MAEKSTGLYVVGTPIGNLEDITFRALRVLKEVGLIAAEDTRVTRKLLNKYEIDTPLTSYHEHNKLSRIPQLLDALAQSDIALVSDAGMPGINDPGAELVRAVSEAGFGVVSVPGASSVTAAVSVSGLAVEQFVYAGFLPRKKGERQRLLDGFKFDKRTVVALETPHRLISSLEEILERLGDRRISVCRELTKLHEEVFRGTVQDAIDHFVQPRGEFTLVIEGSLEEDTSNVVDAQEAASLIARMRRDGVKAKSGVPRIVEMTGMPRRDAYALWLQAGDDASREDDKA
jgi:16S rRNA (cytidine1402-2'-O)-methyltransferase